MKAKIAYTVMAFFVLIGIVNIYQESQRSEEKAKVAQAAQEFEKVLRSAIGKFPPKWLEVKVTEASDRSYSVNLVYSPLAPPSGYGEVERDTKSVARACLRVLLSSGRNPKNERIWVSVSANKPEVGETGAELVRVYGHTHYNYNRDQLVFEPYAK
jgi:hypothetical protein